LKYFSVSTMANSSCSITRYLFCISFNFLLKNPKGFSFCVMMLPI
jgi:hypothetical protein